MFVIRQQRGGKATWLISASPQIWGEQDQAMRFYTRGDARRIATAAGISGDWSINTAAAAQSVGEPLKLATDRG